MSQTSTSTESLDLELLFKLRLAVGRYGEMDKAKWWNTQGVLGPTGRSVYVRGFPRTHPFVRARVVFRVAESRTRDQLKRPHVWTLWNLPPEIEDKLDTKALAWSKDVDSWKPFLDKVEALGGESLAELLQGLELVKQEDLAAAKRLKVEHNAAKVSGEELSADIVKQLAAGYALGDVGSSVIPYWEP